MFHRSPHLELLCSRWSVRRPPEWVKPSPPPPLHQRQPSQRRKHFHGMFASLALPPSSSHSVLLSLSLAGFAIKPAPGESNASARCFLPLPGKAKKNKTMSGDAGYLTGRKPMNYERRSRQGLFDKEVGREEA